VPVKTPPARGTACEQVILDSATFGRGSTVCIVPFVYQELPMTVALATLQDGRDDLGGRCRIRIFKDRQRQVRRDILPPAQRPGCPSWIIRRT
jgi:hypothetical protein